MTATARLLHDLAGQLVTDLPLLQAGPGKALRAVGTFLWVSFGNMTQTVQAVLAHVTASRGEPMTTKPFSRSSKFCISN